MPRPWTVFGATIVVGVVSILPAADGADSRQQSPAEIIRAYRQGMGEELLAAQRDVDIFQRHVDDLEDVKAGYVSSPQAPARLKLQDSQSAAQDSLARAKIRVARLNRVVQATAIAVPVRIDGAASICTTSKNCVPFTLQMALLEGERLDTTSGGRVLLVSDGGTRLNVGTGTSLTFQSYSEAEWLWVLVSGSLSLEREPTAIAGVVGRLRCEAPGLSVIDPRVDGTTAFSIQVDPLHTTHVVLQSGDVEVTADQSVPAKAWWARVIQADEHRALMTGHWGRVRAVKGNATIRRADGAFRRAGVSDELGVSETFAAGIGSAAWCEIAGGYQASLEGPGIMRVLRSKKSSRTVLLDSGKFYFQWNPAKSPEPHSVPAFQTPSVCAATAAADFEVRISADGRSEWTPLKGVLRLQTCASPYRP